MKKKLREKILEERKKLNLEELSKNFVYNIRMTEEYKKAKHVMIFYPLKYEINLLDLLNDSDKNFYLPKIKGQNLLCCSYKNGDVLCESCFKTKEPVNNPVDKSILNLAIVPALAVDKENYRLGYGGGYYDRFLKNIDCKKIVCIPQKFVLDTIYPEKYDIKMDKCIIC